jgi:hypothetical protein
MSTTMDSVSWRLFRDPDGNLINFFTRIAETAHARRPARDELAKLMNGLEDLT